MTQHSTTTSPEFEAKMLAIVTPLIESGAIIKRSDRDLPLTECRFAPYSPKCDTLGHEYDFGICLDCDQHDPNFEPTDDMITADYLRGFDRQAAA